MADEMEITGNLKIDNCTEREIQLNKLHEQIVERRENLLKSTTNHFQAQQNRTGTGTLSSLFGPNRTNNATMRNECLLQDIELLEERIEQGTSNINTPRFVTLQNNFWSMVNGLLPIWEESVGMSTQNFTFSPQRKKHRTPKASRRIK